VGVVVTTPRAITARDYSALAAGKRTFATVSSGSKAEITR
jgi:hypothetical protein